MPFFFNDFSSMDDKERMTYWDAKFVLLRSLPNVLISPHSAFLTHEALTAICNTTISNVEEFVGGRKLTNSVKPKAKAAPKANPKTLNKRVSMMATAPIESCAPPVNHELHPSIIAPNPNVKVAVFSAQPYVKDEMKALMDVYPNSFFRRGGMLVINSNALQGCQNREFVCQ